MICCQYHLETFYLKKGPQSTKILFYDAMSLWSTFVNNLDGFCFLILETVFCGLSSANNMIWFSWSWIWKKTPNVAYHDILIEFNSTWGVKGLIVTQSNLVVTWKVRPQMGIISWLSLGLRWFARVGCILVMFLHLNYSICAKKRKKNMCLILRSLVSRLVLLFLVKWSISNSDQIQRF